MGQLQQPGVSERVTRYRSKPKRGQAKAELVSAWLARMGVGGRIAERLMARVELLADPARVLAWWWYALTQEGVTRPAVMAVDCLQTGEPPPPHYLDLARTWPEVTAAHQLEIQAMLLDATTENDRRGKALDAAAVVQERIRAWQEAKGLVAGDVVSDLNKLREERDAEIGDMR